MRETQIIGLNSWAREFLEKNVVMVPNDLCPHCGGIITFKPRREVWSNQSYMGLCDDGPKLYEYFLKDGMRIREEIQVTPWSSGPCIFLKLQKLEKDGSWVDLSSSIWTDAEIEGFL